MSAPAPAADIALKPFGYTLEVQINEARLYINPVEDFADRRPENGEVILSFIPAGADGEETELWRYMMGIDCYGTPTTHYFLNEPIHTHWKRELANAANVAYSTPGMGRGVHRIRDGRAEVGGCAVRFDELTHERNLYGVRVTAGDTRIAYLPMNPVFAAAFESEPADVVVLVMVRWTQHEEAIRRLITNHSAPYFYLGGVAPRKKEQQAFLASLSPEAAKRVVFKGSKWKVPAAS